MESLITWFGIVYLAYIYSIISQVLSVEIEFTLKYGIVVIGLFLYLNYYVGMAHAIKLCLFFEILLFVFIFDLFSKSIPTFVHYILIGIGLIDINLGWLLHQALPGLLILSVPIFLLNLFLKDKGIGLGDVKLIGSCGFVLGLNNIYIACIFAFLIAWIFEKLLFRQSKDVTFSLAPYLALSFFVFYIL
ncbi:MAG: prepilin peptidase [Eubacteriaceae bacterium]